MTVPHEIQLIYAKLNVIIIYIIIIYSPCAYFHVYQHHLHLHCFTDSTVKYIITDKPTPDIYTFSL